MFYKQIKLFIKTPQIVLTYILLLIVSNIYMCRILYSFEAEYEKAGTAATDSLYFFSDIRYICILFFIAWFFISLEYTKKVNSLHEIFNALGKRSFIPYVNQILIILLGVFIMTANISVYTFLAYNRLYCPVFIMNQMLKVLFFDVFLLSLASSGMGFLVSLIKSKFIGYTIFLLLALVMVPDYYSILRDMLPLGNKVFEKFYSIICFLPQDVTYTSDALYGLPFERYRIADMLFWIILGCTALFGMGRIKKKKLMFCSCGAAALVMLFLVIHSGSVLRMDDELRDVTSYYASHEAQLKSVNYKIEKYRIDFQIKNELTATCRFDLDGDINQNQYYFTLYHDYKVKYVENAAGESLNFQRDGDYITVYTDKPEKSLILSYEGNGGLFYSNNNASFLPGFFPYYPKAGFVKVFDADNLVFTSSQDNTTQFDVSITGKRDFIVNLPQKNNRYQGNTENLTIISGNYEKQEHGTKQYVALPMEKYSYILLDNYKSGNFQKELDDLLKYLGAENTYSWDQSLFVVIPNSTTFATHLQGIYTSDSCILMSEQGRAYDILKEQIGTGNSGSLKDIFFELQPSDDFDIKNIEYYKNILDCEDYTIRDKLYDTVLDKMQSAGVRKTAREIYRYITSEQYNENIEEQLSFVNSIK